jgi:hypothetical protein
VPLQWFTSLIPATWEAETEGSRFEASQGKVIKRPYLKKKLKTKVLGKWLESQRAWMPHGVLAKKKVT